MTSAPSDADKPASGPSGAKPETKPDVKPEVKPGAAPLSATKPVTPSPAGTPPKVAEPAKPTEPVKPEATRTEPPKPGDTKPGDTKPGEPKKPDPVNTAGPSARPGGPAGPVAGAAVTAGPILDLKATRVPEAAKDAPKDAAKVPPKPGEPAKPSDPVKPSPASASAKPGPTPTASPAPAASPKPAVSPAPSLSSASTVPPAAKARGGFGSLAAAGLIGGVIGAGLLFAAEKAGVGGEAGRVAALDQKIAGIDQRLGTFVPKDALAPLDKRVATAEASAKQALDKASAPPPASGEAAVPQDVAARLDNLDQRLSALTEEPGRDAGATAGMGVAQADSTKQLAELDSRVKALEGAAPAAGADDAKAKETADAIAALKSEMETRTKQNADADTALGQKLASLQQSLDAKVQAATESVQAATEASRKAAEAGQSQAAEAAKSVDRKLAEQGDKIAALDKGLADRAPTTTVQAALRVVVADRVASALASGTPYAEPLATLRKLDPSAQDQAEALAPFAEKGAPTTAQLAGTFRGIADKIAQARQAAKVKAASESGDFRTKLLSMADGLVQVRKVEAGAAEANGATAAPEEAVQAALDRGDLAGAAKAFDALPPEAKAQAGDFGQTLAARAKAAGASQTLTAAAFQALPAPAAQK
ncbi:translation initiation factor 2 [Methylobacterium sp. J-067]|uniref:translation initiation factor 2 n=1 Tax=Methylobacterium sp. J-067 TaxID=2836648 RepID=UPI001FBAF3F8|nr:translation initiation factor 2 [Methylobacterium sp. J-067]MCJ2023680.1 translation initiation factor 2 [Methylobacterium sp. J-067]